jgi:hypothetical protein
MFFFVKDFININLKQIKICIELRISLIGEEKQRLKMLISFLVALILQKQGTSAEK